MSSSRRLCGEAVSLNGRDERFWGLLTLLIFQRAQLHEGMYTIQIWLAHPFVSGVSPGPLQTLLGLGRGRYLLVCLGVLLTSLRPLFQVTRVPASYAGGMAGTAARAPGRRASLYSATPSPQGPHNGF